MAETENNMAAERHHTFPIINIHGVTHKRRRPFTHTSPYNMADMSTLATYTQKNSKLSTRSLAAFRMEWIQLA
jgi:hypothetical protein